MDSDKVFVFPCVSRNIKDAQGKELTNQMMKAKLMTEESITNLIKSITDRGSYVLSWEQGSGQKSLLKCVINGYYFEISDISLGDSDKYKYLTIQMNDNDTDAFKLIKGDDLNKNFLGLAEVTGQIRAGSTPASVIDLIGQDALLIGFKGEMPTESYWRFKPSSVYQFSSIDCGELKAKS